MLDKKKIIRSRISPKYTADKITSGNIDDWIDVFEDRIKNWIFQHAHFLLNNKYYHFAVTNLLMPYFESIAMYLKGEDSKKKSKQFFKFGFVSVFSDYKCPIFYLEKIASVIYDNARCGFFHDNMIRSNVFLQENKQALSVITHVKNDKPDFKGEIIAIMISPKQLLFEIEQHFTKYIKNLRERKDAILIDNFKKTWTNKNMPERLFLDSQKVTYYHIGK